MPIKNSRDTIGNQTRDLPGWSAVRKPTAPPRAPLQCSAPLKYDRAGTVLWSVCARNSWHEIRTFACFLSARHISEWLSGRDSSIPTSCNMSDVFYYRFSKFTSRCVIRFVSAFECHEVLLRHEARCWITTRCKYFNASLVKKTAAHFCICPSISLYVFSTCLVYCCS